MKIGLHLHFFVVHSFLLHSISSQGFQIVLKLRMFNTIRHRNGLGLSLSAFDSCLGGDYKLFDLRTTIKLELKECIYWNTQLLFICLNSTIKILQKGVKYVQN